MNERLGFILFYFICFVCFVFMAKTLNAGETFWHADFSSKDYRGTRPHLKLFDRFVLKSIKNEKKINVTGTKGEMVLILEGEFQMGADPKDGYKECKKYNDLCDPEWFYHEGPKHNVNLPSFYIDKYEVVQSKFQSIMGRNPSSFKGENHPAENVRWTEAKEYCEKTGKRLPTEAEWEKAARARATTKYFWGNEMKSGRANFCDVNCLSDWKTDEFDDGYVNTAPVGSYPPNEYGLYDMIGNVWEWVFDWYGDVYYPKSSPHDPKGPVDPLQSYYRLGERVLRGGSWSSHPFNLRSSARAGAFFDTTNINGYGFRCAISALSSN